MYLLGCWAKKYYLHTSHGMFLSEELSVYEGWERSGCPIVLLLVIHKFFCYVISKVTTPQMNNLENMEKTSKWWRADDLGLFCRHRTWAPCSHWGSLQEHFHFFILNFSHFFRMKVSYEHATSDSRKRS